MIDRLRWWLCDQLISLAHWVDPDEAIQEARQNAALKVLEDIAMGKIPPEKAAIEAYAALY